MSACSNCKTKLSCGCQKRTASNGVSVCSTCISQYEADIKSKIQKGETVITKVTLTPGKK